MSRIFTSKHILVVLLIFAITLIGEGKVYAQSRKGVRFSSPGRIARTGTSATRSFTSYSFGVGGLKQPKANSSASVLSSSISTSGGFKISRGSVSSSTPGLSAIPGKAKASGTRIYNPQANLISEARGSFSGINATSKSTLSASTAYVESLTIESETNLSQEVEVITSLVPPNPGIYTDYMKKAERLFRRGRYFDALNEYNLAYYIGPTAPETLLSMVHTNFAMGQYRSAAQYLQRTIKYLPELPLAPLKPKGFYQDPLQYLEQFLRFQTYLDDKSIPDAAGYLLLAYYRWFDDDVEATKQSLSYALGATDNPEVIEAIETFWSGMVATGKVEGELIPINTNEEKENLNSKETMDAEG